MRRPSSSPWSLSWLWGEWWAGTTSSATVAPWDTLLYFATLLTLADGLKRTGVVAWAAESLSAMLQGLPPLVVMASLVAFFFLVHYLFASLTAHTTAVLPALLAAGVAV